MLRRFSDVMSTLQDLSANLLYGDDDDQHISFTELRNSTSLVSRLSPMSQCVVSSAKVGDAKQRPPSTFTNNMC